MGAILRWKIPDTSEVSFDRTYIYRATSKTGTYTQVAYQSISDNTYFDPDGSSAYWYKIRFYSTTDDVWSDYSEPIQGGDFKTYATIEDIRLLAGVPSSVTDSQLYDLLTFAQARVNRDVGVKIEDEKVEYISKEKENDIDGENTTFYVKHPYIGDYNDDGIVNASDIYAYTIDSDGNRETIQVASIDNAKIGKFTVATAPTADKEFYICYRSFPVQVDPPDPLIRQATAYLTGAYAYMKLDIRDTQAFRVGKVAVTRQMPAAQRLMELYHDTLYKIKSIAYKAEADDII